MKKIKMFLFISVFLFGLALLIPNSTINAQSLGIQGGLDAVEGSEAGLSEKSFLDTLVDALDWILAVLAVIAVIAFVGTGIMYITSGGDANRAETAKTWLVYSIIGLVVALLSFVIVRTIDANIVGL